MPGPAKWKRLPCDFVTAPSLSFMGIKKVEPTWRSRWSRPKQCLVISPRPDTVVAVTTHRHLFTSKSTILRHSLAEPAPACLPPRRRGAWGGNPGKTSHPMRASATCNVPTFVIPAEAGIQSRNLRRAPLSYCRHTSGVALIVVTHRACRPVLDSRLRGNDAG